MIHKQDSIGSRIVIWHENEAPCDLMRQWLTPFGWSCDCRGAASEPTIADNDPPALVMMDATIDVEQRTRFLTTLRAMPGPVAGTPVLLLADPTESGQNGISGRIDMPLQREQALAMIEHWAGPVGDHDFRDLSSPHYRLVRLAGRASADRLLLSFADHVERALIRLDSKDDIARIAHEIAGLAGTLGYGELSGLWSAIERDESGDPAVARATTQAVIADLKRLFSNR